MVALAFKWRAHPATLRRLASLSSVRLPARTPQRSLDIRAGAALADPPRTACPVA